MVGCCSQPEVHNDHSCHFWREVRAHVASPTGTTVLGFGSTFGTALPALQKAAPAYSAPHLSTTTTVADRLAQNRSTMPLASSGLRALRVHQPQILGQTGRSIHTPAFLPRPAPSRPNLPGAHAIFKQAKTFLSTVVGHLTAPGAFSSPAHASSASRSMLENVTAHRFPSMQQRLSPSTRFALARPLGAPYLPRGPAVPRNMLQVGLGTARSFSTARPIFDNLAQNVPVTGRAFWGADWEVKMQEEREKLRVQKYQKQQKKKQTRKEMLQPTRAARQSACTSSDVEAVEGETRAELNRYFPAPVVSEITTYLLIPLAPTPTSRLPLQVSPSIHTSNHPLIPFAQLASLHSDHNTHALRVSTVFARLDAAHAFEEPGVSTSAYGDPTGLATILEVKFTGWNEARVRSILGEAGTGWCVLEEVREADVDDALSELSSNPTPAEPAPIDPAASFVLPTLDFSASFAAERDSWARATSAPSPGLADLEFHNAWSAASSEDSLSDFDDALSLSDVDVESEVAWGGSLAPSRRSSVGSVEDGWTALGFSSRFSGQMDGVDGHGQFDEPREAMF